MSEVVLLIPVLGRPQRVRALLDALEGQSDVPYRVLFLCSTGDKAEISAVKKSGCDFLTLTAPPAKGQYAKKINLGYRKSTEPWLFLGADDISFQPGWLEAALAAAGDKFHVVGTNDKANYFVRQGLLATHSLMRRSYIDEVGASLDGPGVIYHEGYSHNFVDCETTTLARQRGVYVYARRSIVPHHHPLFGKHGSDKTYEAGFSEFFIDRKLFCSRVGPLYERDPLVRRFLRGERDHERQQARVDARMRRLRNR